MYTIVDGTQHLCVDGVFRGSDGSEVAVQTRTFAEFSDAAIKAREIRNAGGPTVSIQEGI